MSKRSSFISKHIQASHFYGLSLAFVAGLFLALGGLFSNFLVGTRSQAVLVQFILTFMGSLPFLTMKSEDVFDVRKRVMVQVMAFAVSSFVGTLTFYMSFKYLPMGDVFAIYNTFIVITQVLSCIFLKETCQVSNIIFTILSMAGVVAVAQPDFIFSSSSDVGHSLPNRLYGILFVLASSFATAFTFLISRMIGYNASSVLVMSYRGLFGSLFVAIFMAYVDGGYNLPCKMDCLYLCLSGGCGYTSLLLRHMALQVEQAGPVAVAFTSQIGFAFLFDYFILNYVVNLTCILGAVAIFISAIGTIMKKYFGKVSITRRCRQ